MRIDCIIGLLTIDKMCQNLRLLLSFLATMRAGLTGTSVSPNPWFTCLVAVDDVLADGLSGLVKAFD
ncbi:MAG: hypothetical protein AAF579_05935 [Cyanobacteria bacterium P01_C01_bin.118]